MRKWFWQSSPWQAFKNFAIIFSFVVNFVLIIVLLIALPLIIPILDVVEPIVGGLNTSFEDMNNASIVQTIEVNDTMPISFTLPLSRTTNVTLVEDVRLENIETDFRIDVVGRGATILPGVVSLTLPRGTVLPVALNLDVPVNQEIGVNLDVGVNIPLNETELGVPFSDLQAIFTPLDALVTGLPSSNEEFTKRVQDSIINPGPTPENTVPPPDQEASN